MTPIIRKFVLKLLSKDRGSGITSIPGSQHRMIQESIITDTLLKRGVNPESITSEGMLQSILNGIKKEEAMIARSKADAQKQLATVMDMKGRKIKPGAKIMGGEEVIETEAQIAERLGKGNKQTVENIKEKQLIESFDPDEMATGGRAGFKSGSYLMDGLRSLGKKYKGSTTQAILENPKLLGAELGHDGIMELMNLLPGLFAEGGRAGFAGGGMGRRAFLKLMAALGATGVAAKSGLVSLLGKGGGKQVAKEVVKQSTTTPPPYFFKLVEKIKFMGDDTLATQDKAIAKKYKDYTMQEDFAGNIEIIKKGEDLAGNKLEDVYMKYTVDEVPTKIGKKKSAKVEEYEEFTARPDMEGKMKDVEQGVPNEVVEEAGDIDAMTLKKADGGRIGFRVGGSGKKFIEKIFGKGSLDVMKARDPEMHKGMLEVVEMFRNRDKSGLVEYMQNFLPHMSKKEIQAFIKGDAADIAGQGKYGIDNIQGQMIRLSSGRDYAGKIKMIKDAENMRALDKLDVDKMKPNANGGLQTMLGE